MFFLILAKDIWRWLKTINLLKWNITTNTKRLLINILSLVIVEIAISSGRHNNIMPHFSSFNSTFHTTPRHYSGIWCKLTFKYLVPTNNLTTMFIKIFLNTIGYITLQIMLCCISIFVGKSQFFYSCLTKRAFFPTSFRCFITPYMYKF